MTSTPSLTAVPARAPNEMRPIQFQRQFTRYAEGSVLVSYGHTQVLCNASITENVPKFARNSGSGWLTAEYAMLPRATHQRSERDGKRGQANGRNQEISRLIGRCLRSAVDLSHLPGMAIQIDCDVIQADGGTRTAAISGACVALVDALTHLQEKKYIHHNPFKQLIAGVSVGIYKQELILDLDYQLDSQASTDLNIVMTAAHELIEIQGTAEKQPFSSEALMSLIKLAQTGIDQIIAQQKQALGWD